MNQVPVIIKNFGDTDLHMTIDEFYTMVLATRKLLETNDKTLITKAKRALHLLGVTL